MCKTYNKTPDDPFISDMDPITKLWMFENWIQDQNDSTELAKNHAYLLGSFTNPEAVQQMIGEGAGTHNLTEEEFEASTQIIIDERKAEEEAKQKVPRRKKRKLK